MADDTSPQTDAGIRGTADDPPLKAAADDYCLLHVAINGTEVGWLTWSSDNYLAIAQEKGDATAFRFPLDGGFILPPYGESAQRGLGISAGGYPQFWLDSSWWAQWKLVNGYLQCDSNLQFVGILDPKDPYGSWLKVDDAATPLAVTRQTM